MILILLRSLKYPQDKHLCESNVVEWSDKGKTGKRHSKLSIVSHDVLRFVTYWKNRRKDSQAKQIVRYSLTDVCCLLSSQAQGIL